MWNPGIGKFYNSYIAEFARTLYAHIYNSFADRRVLGENESIWNVSFHKGMRRRRREEVREIFVEFFELKSL